MRLFQSADVLELTGLTRSQLREWTSRDRRNLVPADVEPEGPGRHALYTWQTILVLRLLKALHADFSVEVGAWAPAMNHLRQQLEGVPFPSLWRSIVHFRSREQAQLVIPPLGGNISGGVLVALDPHLLVIATKLSLPPPDQFPLFPAVAVLR
jgi:hypothetical protein